MKVLLFLFVAVGVFVISDDQAVMLSHYTVDDTTCSKRPEAMDFDIVGKCIFMWDQQRYSRKLTLDSENTFASTYTLYEYADHECSLEFNDDKYDLDKCEPAPANEPVQGKIVDVTGAFDLFKSWAQKDSWVTMYYADSKCKTTLTTATGMKWTSPKQCNSTSCNIGMVQICGVFP